MELMIPSTLCLLETIDSFVKFAHIIRMIMVNVSQWLSHENIFRQVALKKGIFNIKLVERPTMIDRDIENKIYNGLFDNRTKSIMIINTWSLMKSFGNKARFVPINRTIR